jgi:hypothetical protein
MDTSARLGSLRIEHFMCRRPIFRSSFLLLVLLFATVGQASPWVADQGDGTYRNPILYADYSDRTAAHQTGQGLDRSLPVLGR